MIAAIVAIDESFGIGYNGNLLERIPEDMKRFKELTIGNAVIMGRKTWDSLPAKPLPNRENIVITSHPQASNDIDVVFWNLEETAEWLDNTMKDVFIIGGGSIYKQFLPCCDTLYITVIHKQFENVDTWFPTIDLEEDWHIESFENGPGCTFLTLKRN